MYGVFLTDNDRKVIQAWLDRSDSDSEWENPLNSEDELYATVKHLEYIGLAVGAYSNSEVVDYRLTDLCRKLALENPSLKSDPDSAQKWEAQERHNLRTELHYNELERQAQESAKYNKRTLCISAIGVIISIAALLISVLLRN